MDGRYFPGYSGFILDRGGGDCLAEHACPIGIPAKLLKIQGSILSTNT